MLCSNNVRCNRCKSNSCELQVKIIMYYDFLGKLLVSSHKTLYAMICRNLYREMRDMGYKFNLAKSEALTRMENRWTDY